MSLLRIEAIAATAMLALVGVAAPARAQSAGDPNNARVQLGPLAASPTIRLTNFGHDSNVYNDNEGNQPRRDFTATVSPAVDAWLRLPRVRVSGRSAFDLFYFKELSDLRAIDGDNSARVELLLNRLTPYVVGNRAVTRHRRDLEIDLPVKRRDEAAVVGVNLRLTAKASIDVATRRSRVAYEGDTQYLDSDLARYLNAKGTGDGVVFRYTLTPFTTVGLQVERQRDRFDLTSERDAESVRIMPEVEFKPLAVVSGRAQVGFRRRTFLNGQTPEFRGTVARVNLGYSLLGRTRFSVEAQRDLVYSYRIFQEEYLLSGLGVSVTQRLVDAWEVGATVGRYRLTYQVGDSGSDAVIAAASPAETVLNYGADVGYRVGSTRLGVQIDFRERQSDLSRHRQYERLRITSSLTYDF